MFDTDRVSSRGAVDYTHISVVSVRGVSNVFGYLVMLCVASCYTRYMELLS